MYRDGSLLRRKMQHWRPYICPFERLAPHVPDGARVLDIGCGAGLLLSLLAGLGLKFEGVGFDVSQAAIRTAHEMVRRATALSLPATLAFEQLHFEASWPDGEFDVVFLIDVLHHVPRQTQKDFLVRATSKVRRGGTFVYKDMCSRPWWRAQANRLHDLVIAQERISYVPVSTVEQWAASNQMEIVASENLNRLWYGHELRVMKAL